MSEEDLEECMSDNERWRRDYNNEARLGWSDKVEQIKAITARLRGAQDKLAPFVAAAAPPTRGWYEMACWNGLSAEQQTMLIESGVLFAGHWVPEGGTCTNGAEVEVSTMWDKAPGPRFYCLSCAVEYLMGQPPDDQRHQYVKDLVERVATLEHKMDNIGAQPLRAKPKIYPADEP